MFDDALLARYCDTFYGYGDYSGRYWFVGMEEGGGKTTEENARRIAAWDRRGRREIDDLSEYHHAIGVARYFAGRPPIQATWGKLIRILLAAEGEPSPATEAVRLYQRDRLGRSGEDTCLLELLPLPSPATSQWMYGKHTELPQLSTRLAYREHYGELRAERIRARVEQHKPAAVVFYGFHNWYRQWWEIIAGAPFRQAGSGPDRFLLAGNGQTVFAIVKHPSGRGLANEYFHGVGRALREQRKRVAAEGDLP